MSYNSNMNEQAPRINPDTEEQPETGLELEKLETTETPEMPADFVEPEGKSGGWGEVVENKELGVRYREKVIELPKHRQEETGVKRIRRREMLPPFPEGLLLQEVDDKNLQYWSGDEAFDEVYNFFTSNGYPSEGTLVHIMNFMRENDQEKIQKNIREGLYFQEIHAENEYGFRLCPDRTYVGKFTTPVFVFGNRNSVLNEYVDSVINDPVSEWGVEFEGKWAIRLGKHEYSWPEVSHDLKRLRNRKHIDAGEVSLPYFGRLENSSKRQLRWCHAELALVPTKRSLNVLFFETE